LPCEEYPSMAMASLWAVRKRTHYQTLPHVQSGLYLSGLSPLFPIVFWSYHEEISNSGNPRAQPHEAFLPCRRQSMGSQGILSECVCIIPKPVNNSCCTSLTDMMRVQTTTTCSRVTGYHRVVYHLPVSGVRMLAHDASIHRRRPPGQK